MRRLVTGDRGHIGAVLTPMPTAVGHEVVGLAKIRQHLPDDDPQWTVPRGIDHLAHDLREGVTP